jgi:hypothetical protein
MGFIVLSLLSKFAVFIKMIGSCCVVQADFELAILLPLLLECWDYRFEPLSLAKRTLLKDYFKRFICHQYLKIFLGREIKEAITIKSGLPRDGCKR